MATAAIQFFRSMGGSLAVAGLGALLTARLGAGIDANRLTAGAGHVSEAARSALGDATHAVFVALVPLAAAVFVLSILLPEERLHTPRTGPDELGRTKLARGGAGDLLAQVADFGVVRELQRALARGQAVRDAIGARQRVGVARPGAAESGAITVACSQALTSAPTSPDRLATSARSSRPCSVGPASRARSSASRAPSRSNTRSRRRPSRSQAEASDGAAAVSRSAASTAWESAPMSS